MKYRFKVCCCCNTQAATKQRKCRGCGGDVFRSPTHPEIVDRADRLRRLNDLIEEADLLSKDIADGENNDRTGKG